MKLHQWGWVVVLLGAAMPAAADQVDINFSGDAAAFSYIKPLQTEGLELGGRWLHDTEDGDIADANLHMVDRPSRVVTPWCSVLAVSCRRLWMMCATPTVRL